MAFLAYENKRALAHLPSSLERLKSMSEFDHKFARQPDLAHFPEQIGVKS